MKTQLLKLVLFLILTSPINLLAQKSYIMVDGDIDYNVRIQKASAKEMCYGINVTKDGKVTSMTPYEIEQFSLKNGNSYLSKEIKIGGEFKKVFLRKVISGKFNLYYFLGKEFKFYYRINEDFGQLGIDSKGKIDSKSMNFLISKNENCDKVKPSLFNQRATKLNVEQIFSVLNDCKKEKTNSLKLSIFGGQLYTKIATSTQENLAFLKRADFNESRNSAFGLKIDYGGRMIGVSSEIYYHSVHMRSRQGGEIFSDEVFIFQDYLNHTLALRFSTPGFRIKAYLEFGIQSSFLLNDDISTHVISEDYGSMIFRKLDTVPLVGKYQASMLGKSGLVYRINRNIELYGEYRYLDLINETSGNSIIDLKHFGPFVGMTIRNK